MAIRLIDVIVRFRAETARYNRECVGDLSSEACDDLADASFMPWLMALAAWDEPAQSHEEADAALTLAADELRNISNSGMVLAMVKAASGWLSSEEPQRLAA